jgi:transposase
MEDYFGHLYRIEATIKHEGMSLKQKAAYRVEHSLPIMLSLKERLIIVQAQFSQRPPSKLLTACNYMLSDWDGFMVFTSNPEVPIDNNATERRFRGHAVGRKSWLWNMSEEGAEWVCNFYTIVESCILIGISPRQYLDAVLPQLKADLKPDYAALTPRRWKEAQGNAAMQVQAA